MRSLVFVVVVALVASWHAAAQEFPGQPLSIESGGAPALVNPVTGVCGTTNALAYFSGASTLACSAAFIADPTNKRIGINASSPTVGLEIHESTGNAIASLLAKNTTSGGGAQIIAEVTAGSASSIVEALSDASADYSAVLANNTSGGSAGFIEMTTGGSGSFDDFFGLSGFTYLIARPAGGGSPNGLAIGLPDVAKPIVFGTNGTERGSFESDGPFSLKEQAAPGVDAGRSDFYDDSTTHTAQLSNNGDSYSSIARADGSLLASDYTNATTTFTTVQSIALPVGSWACHATGAMQDSTSSNGVDMKWNNSGLTLSTQTSGFTFEHDGNAAPHVQAAQAGLATLAATTFGTGYYDGFANVVVTVAGTLQVQASLDTTTTGTLTIYKGALLRCNRI